MKLRNWILLAALAAVTACSGMRHRESDQVTLERYMDYSGQPVESFSYLGRFDSWRALGRNKLVVWTGLNDAYLLTVQEPCQDLQFAQRIGLTSTTGSVHRGFDSVRLGRHEQCRITEIRPVNYKDLRAAERAGG
jgi:hypothetical protein